MSADQPADQIEVGRDGRGSRPSPPDPACECVAHTAGQRRPALPGACTISLHGIRGGAGTSTIAAVLALTGRALVRTELVTAEIPMLAALLGTGDPDPLPVEVLPNLILSDEPTGGAALEVVDSGSLGDGTRVGRRPGERRLGVLRGPCYLSLRSLMHADHDLDGIVLLAEPGRALTERDVTDVTGLDIVAVVPVTPAVARSIDAGLLVSRLAHRREFRRLQRWLTGELDPFPSTPLATNPLHHPTPQ